MKQLFTVLIVIFGLSSIHAQSSLRLGLTASPNIGWLSLDTRGVNNDGNRIGFRYGILADFSFAENYAFSTGLFLNHTGGKISFPTAVGADGNAAIGSTESEIKLQYIDLPLTLKLRTNEIGYITYYGQIGFDLSINIGAKADATVKDANGTTLFSTDDEKITGDINLFKLGLHVGAGAEYNLSGNTSILIGLSYHNGFTNVMDFEVPKTERDGSLSTSGETEEVKGFNSFVSLNLGVLF